MLFFALLIILTVVSGLLYKGKVISKKAACIIISVYAIFLFGARTENVGNVDVPRYVAAYETLVFEEFSEIAFLFNRDLTFYFFAKLIAFVSSSYNIWFAIMGALFIFSVSELIIKYSNRIIMSYIIFFVFSYALNFSLLRHCCALAFVIHGYIAIKDDKTKKAIIFILIASLFHLSAIVAIIFVPLKKIKFGKWNIFLITGTALISALIPNLLDIIIRLLSMNRFAPYIENKVMTLTYSAFIINLTFFLIVLILILIKNTRLKEKYYFELNMFSIAVAFYSLVGILAEFLRVAMFFSFILIVLLPNVLDEFKYSRNKYFINAGAFVLNLLLLIYFFTKVLSDGQLLPYEFNSIALADFP